MARIREVLPPEAAALETDRTAREVVVRNLFVALQECLSLAMHWSAGEGWEVPQGYGATFTLLGEHGMLERDLASRLAAASGLRNLIAHRHDALDWRRLHAIASEELDDLLRYCAALARRVQGRGGPRPGPLTTGPARGPHTPLASRYPFISAR